MDNRDKNVIKSSDDNFLKEMEYNERTMRRRQAVQRPSIAPVKKYSNERGNQKQQKDKESGLLQRLDFKRITIVVGVLLTVILLFTVVIPSTANAKYCDAYEVFLNGESIGITDDIEQMSIIMDTIYSDIENYYGMDISKDYKFTFESVKVDDQYIYPVELYDTMLRQSLDVGVMAWVIYVNNAPAAVLQTQEDAQSVLSEILAPYKTGTNGIERTNVTFLENIEIKNDPVNYSNIVDKEKAVELLKYGGEVHETYHTVVTGETLYSIAKIYDVRLADIKKANPMLSTSNKIYRNDKLFIAEINNRVNITYTERVSRQEAMPYETIVIKDDTMYKTETKVQQEGVEGRRDVVLDITYINGSESHVELIELVSELKQSVDKIVVKGTKKVPNILVLAQEGRMPMPVENYTLTSGFGPRNTGILGASTYHNGVDLAAPKGTPIYASADGKVTLAGSNGGYGLMVKIDHDGGVETKYGHCSQILVSKGQYVEAGEIIALVGSTGTSSGNHVHFEVRINGTPIDPFG